MISSCARTCLGGGGGLAGSHGDAEDGIGAQLRLVVGAVELDQKRVERTLVDRVELSFNNRRSDDVVDVGQRLANALAMVVVGFFVAQFQGLENAAQGGLLSVSLGPHPPATTRCPKRVLIHAQSRSARSAAPCYPGQTRGGARQRLTVNHRESSRGMRSNGHRARPMSPTQAARRQGPATRTSWMPVDAPDGTAARKVPLAVVRSTSTVGLPRLSKIIRALMAVMGKTVDGCKEGRKRRRRRRRRVTSEGGRSVTHGVTMLCGGRATHGCARAHRCLLCAGRSVHARVSATAVVGGWAQP